MPAEVINWLTKWLGKPTFWQNYVHLADLFETPIYIWNCAETSSQWFYAKHVCRVTSYPAGNYLFQVNNRNTSTRCEIYSKLTIKTPERRQYCRSGVFIVNFEHIPRLNLVFLLFTLSRLVHVGWDIPIMTQDK